MVCGGKQLSKDVTCHYFYLILLDGNRRGVGESSLGVN